METMTDEQKALFGKMTDVLVSAEPENELQFKPMILNDHCMILQISQITGEIKFFDKDVLEKVVAEND